MTGGPTPAQIAAAAHAAAIQAKLQGETVEPSSADELSTEPVELSSEPKVDQPQDVPVDVAAPKKSRRRSRSAKSPAFSVPPAAAPVTGQSVVVEPAVERPSVERPTTPAVPTPIVEEVQVAEVAQVAEVTAPPARGRRKRPRVVAPAGPPRSAGQPEAASGEFGS